MRKNHFLVSCFLGSGLVSYIHRHEMRRLTIPSSCSRSESGVPDDRLLSSPPGKSRNCWKRMPAENTRDTGSTALERTSPMKIIQSMYECKQQKKAFYYSPTSLSHERRQDYLDEEVIKIEPSIRKSTTNQSLNSNKRRKRECSVN